MATTTQHYRGYELHTVTIPIAGCEPYTKIMHRGELVEVVEDVGEARVVIDAWMDAR